MELLKFEQFFKHDKDLYDGLIYFFDELIKKNKNDFVGIIEKMSLGMSAPTRENIGYNLPEDTEYENMDYIEIWWVCGLDEFDCKVDFKMFIESLELAVKIWMKNNNINSHDDIAHKIESYIKIIKHRYM